MSGRESFKIVPDFGGAIGGSVVVAEAAVVVSWDWGCVAAAAAAVVSDGALFRAVMACSSYSFRNPFTLLSFVSLF